NQVRPTSRCCKNSPQIHASGRQNQDVISRLLQPTDK
ncbi:jg12122, partial [Pararge aegeria aegeria]